MNACAGAQAQQEYTCEGGACPQPGKPILCVTPSRALVPSRRALEEQQSECMSQGQRAAYELEMQQLRVEAFLAQKEVVREALAGTGVRVVVDCSYGEGRTLPGSTALQECTAAVLMHVGGRNRTLGGRFAFSAAIAQFELQSILFASALALREHVPIKA